MYVCVVCICACVCVVFICTRACLHEVSTLFVVCPFPSKYTFLLCIIIFSACITSLATFVSLSRSLALSLSRSPGLSRARVRTRTPSRCCSLFLSLSLSLSPFVCLSLSLLFSPVLSQFLHQVPSILAFELPCSTLQHTATHCTTIQHTAAVSPSDSSFL